MRLRLPHPDMDLAKMADRVAAGDPRRRAIFTKRSNVDSDAPGRPQMRKKSEMEDYLGQDRQNAVMLEAEDGWVAVYIDVSSGQFAVSKVPIAEPTNLLGKKVDDASDALAAAMQLA